MAKALKVFIGLSGKEYQVGDKVKKTDIEDRHIKSKRIDVSVSNKVETTEIIDEVVEAHKEELLTELSDEVKVETVEEIMEDGVIQTDDRSMLGKLFGK
jgi:hypothetical protein